MDLFVSFYMKKSRTIFWPEAFVEGVYFTVDISGFFIKDQMYIGMCIYVWVLNIIPLIEVSVFMPWQCCFVVWLKIRNGDPSRNFFIVQYCFTYPGLFAFFMWSWEMYCWISIGKMTASEFPAASAINCGPTVTGPLFMQQPCGTFISYWVCLLLLQLKITFN